MGKPKGSNKANSSCFKTVEAVAESDKVGKENDLLRGLPDSEVRFIESISLRWDGGSSSTKKSGKNAAAAAAAAGDAFVEKAVDILETNNMLIVHNAFPLDSIDTFTRTYASLLDLNQHAIGEKDPSKRSGTRWYNCPCQLGSSCKFKHWKGSTQAAQACLHSPDPRSPALIYERICAAFGFGHIARVEVVTAHCGARNQGWHIDGAHGLTVIIPLVDVDVQKGPTELDFRIAFNNLHSSSGKVKTGPGSGSSSSSSSSGSSCSGSSSGGVAPSTVHAVMPKGSVLMFNANVSHRGTANISTCDRPILVLDTSPICTQITDIADIWLGGEGEGEGEGVVIGT